MQEEKREEERPGEERDPKRAVNPAARHDDPAPVKPQPHHGAEEEPVPPTQEEPLDPLGPGGIGA